MRHYVTKSRTFSQPMCANVFGKYQDEKYEGDARKDWSVAVPDCEDQDQETAHLTVHSPVLSSQITA
jgi:hypothetical protein